MRQSTGFWIVAIALGLASCGRSDVYRNPRVDHPDVPNTGLGPPWADIGAHERQP